MAAKSPNCRACSIAVLPAAEDGELRFEAVDAPIQPRERFRKRSDPLGQVAALFAIVPTEHEMPRVDGPLAIVLFVPQTAHLHMPFGRSTRAAATAAKFLDRVAAAKVESLGQFRLNPGQQRMARAEIELAEQRLGMQSGCGGFVAAGVDFQDTRIFGRGFARRPAASDRRSRSPGRKISAARAGSARIPAAPFPATAPSDARRA